MLDSILKALGVGGRPVPKYGADELEFHTERYGIHVRGACAALHGVLAERGYGLLHDRPEGVEPPSALLGRVRHTWLDTVEGWMKREFVPKVRRFTPPDRSVPFRGRGREVPRSCDMAEVEAHMRLADEHAERMICVLRYLLCDPSSPVRWCDSLEPDAGPSEVTAWYTGGLRIVEDCVRKTSDALRKVRERAKAMNEVKCDIIKPSVPARHETKGMNS